MVLSVHQRIKALTRNVCGGAIQFPLLADFRIVHAGSVKEVRVGWTRLERGYAHVRVFQLVTHTMSKGQNKCFCCCVNRFSRSDHLSSDRCGEQYSAGISIRHMAHNVFSQLHGAGAVEINHVEFFVQTGIPEETSNPDASVDSSHIEGASHFQDLIPQSLWAIPFRQIDLHFGHLCA